MLKYKGETWLAVKPNGYAAYAGPQRRAKAWAKAFKGKAVRAADYRPGQPL